jgi:hypothetical protein
MARGKGRPKTLESLTSWIEEEAERKLKTLVATGKIKRKNIGGVDNGRK